MMSFFEACQSPGCALRAVFYCECVVGRSVFCESHSEQHRSGSHVLAPLFLLFSTGERALLQNFRGEVEDSYSLQHRALHKQSQVKFKRIEQKLNKVNSQLIESLGTLSDRFNDISRALGSALEYGCLPVLGTHQLLAALVQAKLQNTQLTAESLSKAITDCEFTLRLQYTPNSQSSLESSVYLLEGKMQVLQKDLGQRMVESPLISPYSRCLPLDSEHILMTGGLYDSIADSRKTSIISVKHLTVTPSALMSTGRAFHAMTWLLNRPAVIGGFSQTSLASVEVFEQGKWQEAPYLHRARHEHGACCSHSATFVVAGKNSRTVHSRVKHFPVWGIEKFAGGRWEELSLRFPFDSHDFCEELGVVSLSEDSLLIFGGWDDHLEVIEYNMQNCKFRVIANATGLSKFPWNLWVRNDNEFVGFDDGGEVLSFRI